MKLCEDRCLVSDDALLDVLRIRPKLTHNTFTYSGGVRLLARWKYTRSYLTSRRTSTWVLGLDATRTPTMPSLRLPGISAPLFQRYMIEETGVVADTGVSKSLGYKRLLASPTRLTVV